MLDVIDPDGGVHQVDIVGHVGGGHVVRRRDGARTVRDLCWIEGDRSVLHPLVGGPSFLALLEVFPRGSLPAETACALVEMLTAPPHGMAASLGRLRFDLDEHVFRWCGAPIRRSRPVRAFEPWRTGVISRLLGRHGPRFETMFARREVASAPWQLGELPWREVEAGRRHLAGIVEATLGDRVAEARLMREQWWLHDGDAPPPTPAPSSDVARKAELLFIEAEHDLMSDNVTSARMNMQLATLYGPESRRYQRAVRALTS